MTDKVTNILLFSGGLDSTVLLYKLKPNVKCISFDYGQRHHQEIANAARICNENNVEHVVADLVAINPLISKGSQSGHEPVPEGHYASETMKTTIVPNRNAIMLSIAVGWAVATGCDHVYFAAHAGDHAIYPDCRPEFLYNFQRAMLLGNEWSPVTVMAPFIDIPKEGIVGLGNDLGVPFHLTRSCYNSGDRHCGRCGTCVERKEAFQLSGVPDPTEYETV